MNKTILAATAVMAILATSLRAEKKVLNHDSFDDWKSVTNYSLSRNGEWAAYAVNPQEGDGEMTVYNTRNGKKTVLPRGYMPAFTADSRWCVARIKPFYAETRKQKIAKKKDFDLPQDSLAIIRLADLTVEKIGNVTSYKLAKDGGEWVAYQSCDTAYIKPKDLKDKESGKPLVVRNLHNGTSKVTKWVSSYDFSKDGSKIALNVRKSEKDTVNTNSVGVMFLPDTSYVLLDRDKNYYGDPVFNEKGDALAYTASDDSIKTGTKDVDVYYSNLGNPMITPREIKLTFKDGKGNSLRPNQYTKPVFSHNGRRLVAGVAPIIAPDDTTLVDFETAELDIWRWDAPYTPPQDKKKLTKIKERNYPVVIDLSDMSTRLVTDNPLAKVETPDRWDGDYALLVDPTEKVVSQQWDYFAPCEMKVVNLKNGATGSAGMAAEEYIELSPSDRYVLWYADKKYYTYDNKTGKSVCISEKVPVPLWDEDNDNPMPKPPYGMAGWSKDDNAVLVYDRHDIWSLDPAGVKDPVCLTAGEGRKRNLRFRYRNTDPERRFISEGDEVLLDVFDYKDKYFGLALMKYGKPAAPKVAVLNEYAYTQVRRARNAQVYTWQRANFSTSPDIWLAKGTDFLKARQLTDANPQMKDYRWGTARLVKWTAYDGKESEGVLYVPDDIDPNKKYPMLCVFYETGSEDLYRHYTMEPSWSWVNYPFYVSRGYVIFVPDIHYTAGVPGESCYNYVCSGAEEMCRRYPWIDKDRIGIDGQSWGGYQTAYLVTRTNMFACAGSGAPVANMTSAFGGIRWESGDSRQGQYELGQSRIGRNLWEAPELYIANSPVFHANRVNTPLLIMHNDADGAVPWYQGIEMFMALRRLEKPVWMLQYNGEAHNIRARKNRKDITKRLQQFFDHYLKGEPLPKWMKEGIPVERKGQEMGY